MKDWSYLFKILYNVDALYFFFMHFFSSFFSLCQCRDDLYKFMPESYTFCLGHVVYHKWFMQYNMSIM